MTLSDYKITEKIYENFRTVVYRAQTKQGKNTVIIKLLKAEYPTLEELAQVKHEYEIAKDLDLSGIIKPYALENHKNGLALILEDFYGKALHLFIGDQKLPLISFLNIAIQLAESLSNLHEHQIIHKDIKPQNILINPKNGQVKICDFSTASRLTRENPTLSSPNLMQGTLAYMSPEQTGRMNRSIDYRTDFYSLGITFYEMLTGALPFPTSDLLELVHCHIAKKPVPLQQLNPEIPQVVSDIIMKLLAKTAEDRYQSAYGLKADLETCLTQLQANGKISNFIVGQQDLFSQFLIPQKLYGREKEVAQLLAAFESVSGGRTQMMLVSGYSGIGKSSLVNEIHKPILRQRGYFIAGKFDQFKRNIPYISLIQAFQELIQQILAESQEKIAFWKKQLLAALGSNSQVIIDVIPSIELIIGLQPSLPQLGFTESQNRFNQVFQKFIQVFTKREHPLVLFLDDLQWADAASLKLIQLLINDPDSQYLLLIGAYRDNEVNPTHPLVSTLDAIKKNEVVVNHLFLSPLNIHNTRELVADTLREKEKSKELADLVFQESQGNPFFLTQMLTYFHKEKLLTFDFITGGWKWDIQQIKTCGIHDYSVVELITRTIEKLPEETQTVLTVAACIGNQFNLDILAIISKKSQSEIAADLWSAIQAGLILPLSETYKIPMLLSTQVAADSRDEQQTEHNRPLTISYKFLHDRVQQAVYLLIPDEQKKETHLKIGQVLLKNADSSELEEKIFDIVNQMNAGIEFINTIEQKNQLAHLNLIAGKKAKAATAYESAVKYLNVALELLEESSWQDQYDLTLELYIEAAEAEYLNINFIQAEKFSEVVIKHAKNLLQKVKVYETKIQFYTARSQMQLAIDTSLEVLQILGEPLSQEPPSELIIEDLLHLPEMTDPYKLVTMRLLMTLMPATLAANPAMLPQVTFTMINLSIRYGNCSQSAYAYAFYGLLLCGALKDIESGYRFGQLALKLVEKFNARELKPKISNIFNGFVRHWKAHAKETIEPLQESIQNALEIGDVEYACFNATTYSVYIFYVGKPLDYVNQEQSKYIDMMLRFKQETQLYYAKICNQLVLNLTDESGNKSSLVGESFNELEMLPVFIQTNNFILLFLAHLAKTILLYLFKEYEGAVANAKEAEKYAAGVVGFMHITQHNFYYSLALLALYPHAEVSAQQLYIKQVEENQEKMQQWAESAPLNYQHKYELVEAEKARVLGKILEAMEYYDRAITGANEQGYIQEEALASELASEFYFSCGREKVAQTYLIDSYYGYIRWGATAKVRDLESRYPGIFTWLLARQQTVGIEVDQTTSTTGVALNTLDFTTVMKASQALADEIVLSHLLDKLLKIVMANAGAQRACLILEKEGQLLIEAVGTVEENNVVLLSSAPVENSQQLPLSLLNYVARTRENVVLNNASKVGAFTNDPYFFKTQVKSVLCTPIINQSKLIGLLYLENNLTTDAFTPARLETLRILSGQAAISLKNALLYANLEVATENLQKAKDQLEDYSQTLEQKVEDRTLELKEKNDHLHEALQELQHTQTQLIQTEKMSSLGQLVAGVAHEINNPVNFIYGNLTHASRYLQDLLHLVDLYERNYPDPLPEIEGEIEAIELDFLKEDFTKILSSMQVGADRIRQIVLSLRNFSRLDEAEMKQVNIHEGIDSTLLILQHRLKDKVGYPNIQVIKEYGQLPLVECYAGQLNQAFMNILTNAIDALEDSNRHHSAAEIQDNLNTIGIYTGVTAANQVMIRISDNGSGMTEEVRSKVFDPFFTTKPVGSGTGLGLSISYQIVVEKHKGQLKCISTPGQGTQFVIEIPIKRGN